jgi:ABC-type uncharacterized transport system permease subunit
MSLKAFHILFITVSTLMCFGVAGWAFREYSLLGGAGWLAFGIGSALCGVGLLVYGRYFLKKLKHISYL